MLADELLAARAAAQSFSTPRREPSPARARSSISKRGSAGAALKGRMGWASSSNESQRERRGRPPRPDPVMRGRGLKFAHCHRNISTRLRPRCLALRQASSAPAIA